MTSLMIKIIFPLISCFNSIKIWNNSTKSNSKNQKKNVKIENYENIIKIKI